MRACRVYAYTMQISMQLARECAAVMATARVLLSQPERSTPALLARTVETLVLCDYALLTQIDEQYDATEDDATHSL